MGHPPYPLGDAHRAESLANPRAGYRGGHTPGLPPPGTRTRPDAAPARANDQSGAPARRRGARKVPHGRIRSAWTLALFLNAGARTAAGATSHFSGYTRGRAPPHSHGDGTRPLHQLQLSYSGPSASSTTGCTLPRNAGAQRKCGSTWSHRNPGRRSPSSSTGSSPEQRRP